MEDTKVVRLTDFKARKEPPEETGGKELDNLFNASDAVLDIIEENFEEGICIGMADGYIQLVSTVDDIDTIIFMLEEALYNVRSDY